MANSFGLPLALPFRPELAINSENQISIRANDIALSRNYIQGISIQNQLKGQICALIANGESTIVQIDCGKTLVAEITPSACRTMNLKEGDMVYCLIKTHSISYLAELDTSVYRRALSYGNDIYYLDDNKTLAVSE